jgi:hypothetical protein
MGEVRNYGMWTRLLVESEMMLAAKYATALGGYATSDNEGEDGLMETAGVDADAAGVCSGAAGRGGWKCR